MVEDVVTPVGPYRLALMARSGTWRGALSGRRVAMAHQRADGRVVVRAPDEEALASARFMLALDDDTTGFHRRFASDPLIGPSARALVGYRPRRVATVAHAVVRALCGQLIEARRARMLERAIARACDDDVVAQDALRRLSPLELRRLGLAQHRATALHHLAATIDFESLRAHPTATVAARLGRERAVGPWSIGVISLEGLGRYDHGIVGDLSLVKLHSSLTDGGSRGTRRPPSSPRTASGRGSPARSCSSGGRAGSVPGASADLARIARRRARRAA